MLHQVYLSGLCSRRNWPDPQYRFFQTGQGGFACVVRVNNREYQTSKQYESQTAAKEAAALTAYTICRSFSVNDGMYPTGFDHSGVIQGTPVPVGSGRSARGGTEVQVNYRYRGDSDSSSRSGGSSPDLSHDPRHTQLRRPPPINNTYVSRRHEPRYVRYTSTRT